MAEEKGESLIALNSAFFWSDQSYQNSTPALTPLITERGFSTLAKPPIKGWFVDSSVLEADRKLAKDPA